MFVDKVVYLEDLVVYDVAFLEEKLFEFKCNSCHSTSCEGIGESPSVYPSSYCIEYKSKVDLVDRDLLST